MGRIEKGVYYFEWSNEEDCMLEITATATEQISEFFKGKDVSPIRIFLNEGGWGGPSLAMALDEPKDADNVYDIEGFKYVVNKDFMEKAKPIKVDYIDIGFKVTSELIAEAGCNGCGTADTGCAW